MDNQDILIQENRRDEFTLATKRALAGRVGHICSNPACKRQTIGPGSEKDQTINLGEAAHITAAAPGGKRYNRDLSHAERSDSDNGIWLCTFCAKLVDSDEEAYSVVLLKIWKHQAEQSARNAIAGLQQNDNQPVRRPFAEPDLIWITKSRHNNGANLWRTKEYQKEQGGRPLTQFDVIYNWLITWRYNFKIYNNSSVPLINVKIHRNKERPFFSKITPLEKVNNIPALSEKTLEAEYATLFVGTGKESLPVFEPIFPPFLNGMQFILEYQDEARNTYYNECTFLDGDFTVNAVAGLGEQFEK